MTIVMEVADRVGQCDATESDYSTRGEDGSNHRQAGGDHRDGGDEHHHDPDRCVQAEGAHRLTTKDRGD